MPLVPDPKDYPPELHPRVQQVLEVGAPPAYDRSRGFCEMLNQGAVPACVPFSTCHGIQIDHNLDRQVCHRFDPMTLYRELGGNGSNGIDTRLTLQRCVDTGAPLRDGNRIKIGSYFRCDNIPGRFEEQIKAAIAADQVVVIAVLLPSTFGGTWREGSVTSGYHQLVVCRYNGRLFGGPNTWGTNWGAGGFYELSFDYCIANNFQNGYCYAFFFDPVLAVNPNPTPTPIPIPTPTPEPVAEILRLTNAARAQAGLTPLTLNAQLTAAAVGHAQHMANTGTFGHDGIGDGTPLDRISKAGYTNPVVWGENIAAGQIDPSVSGAKGWHHQSAWHSETNLSTSPVFPFHEPTPEGAFTAWMNSPGHRANILFPGFKEIGIAHVEKSPSQYGHYWVQNFGTRSDSPAPEPLPEPLPTPDNLRIQSVAGTRQIAAVRLNEPLTVIGDGFGAGVIRAQVGSSECRVTVLDEHTLKVSAISAPLAGTLTVRREGAVAEGPAVAVLMNGEAPTPVPDPEPQPQELMVEAVVAVVGASRQLLVTVHDAGGQAVTATVRASIGGVDQGVQQTRVLGGRVVAARWLVRAAAGTPIVVTAETADGRRGRRELSA